METDRQREAVLKAFLAPDGSLTTMPTRATKRRYVLEHIAAAFEPGVRYTELEVNAVLRAFYEKDYVALRRYLVESGFLERENATATYWRSGGYVEV